MDTRQLSYRAGWVAESRTCLCDALLSSIIFLVFLWVGAAVLSLWSLCPRCYIVSYATMLEFPFRQFLPSWHSLSLYQLVRAVFSFALSQCQDLDDKRWTKIGDQCKNSYRRWPHNAAQLTFGYASYLKLLREEVLLRYGTRVRKYLQVECSRAALRTFPYQCERVW